MATTKKTTAAKSAPAKTTKTAATAKSATTAKSTKPAATAKSAATKTTAAKTNKSGKKIVKAAPVAEHKAAAGGGGLDVGGLLSGVLGSLGGGGSEGGEGGMGGLLSGVLGALTGGNEHGSEGGGLNVASIAEMLLPMLSKDGGMLDTFKKHPTKTIEKLIGIDLPDDKIDPVVKLVLDRLGNNK